MHGSEFLGKRTERIQAALRILSGEAGTNQAGQIAMDLCPMHIGRAGKLG